LADPATPQNQDTSALPEELIVAAGAAGSVAAAILNAKGKTGLAQIIPLTEQLFASAIRAFTLAHGAPPTVEQFQALLGDVPLVPPTE